MRGTLFNVPQRHIREEVVEDPQDALYKRMRMEQIEGTLTPNEEAILKKPATTPLEVATAMLLIVKQDGTVGANFGKLLNPNTATTISSVFLLPEYTEYGIHADALLKIYSQLATPSGTMDNMRIYALESERTLHENAMTKLSIAIKSAVDPLQPVQPTIPSTAPPLGAQIKILEAEMERIVKKGLQPVYLFVSMLATETTGGGGAADYYNTKSPIVKGAKDFEEFASNNSHLGEELLMLAAQSIKRGTKLFAPIGVDVAQVPSSVTDDEMARNLRDLVMSDDTRQQWVFGALDDQVLSYLLADTTIGAMHLGMSRLNRIPGCEDFTLRQILLSPGVRDNFAILCALQYVLGAGGNAYVKGISSGGGGRVRGTSFMVSAGMETRRTLLHKLDVLQFWFRDAYKTMNAAYTALENYIKNVNAEIAQLEQQHTIDQSILDVVRQVLDVPRKGLAALNAARDAVTYLDPTYLLREKLGSIPRGASPTDVQYLRAWIHKLIAVRQLDYLPKQVIMHDG